MPARRLAHDLTPEAGWARQAAAWTIDQGRAIQSIAAPTFAEGQRAAWVEAAFRSYGLSDVATDAVFNVFGHLHGSAASRPALLITAHTDTIFNADTDLTQRTEGGLLYGPGLGDNSIAVAALLALARELTRRVAPPVDIWFVATSREEGLGDLGGMKAAFERLGAKTGAVLNIEGLALGHVYHGGIAVRRLKVTAAAGGGHSWLHYGRPSAIHALVALCGKLLQLVPPLTPRTTFNIGLIEGGDAVNAIASRAACWLDLRSETSSALAGFEDAIRGIISDDASDGVAFTIDVVGDRPAGNIPVTHPLVQIGIQALAAVGVEAILDTGSTDANVPLAAGCPAITLGVTRGGNAHRTDEFIESAPVAAGLAHLMTAVQLAQRDLAEG
ncbi:MAG: M20/M25/M40 family metallo-hydrolase [Anaerolineae bacterium]|nr:M20/M25/M40 family metallo-hydrolase [Anaerolineae bacterium]